MEHCPLLFKTTTLSLTACSWCLFFVPLVHQNQHVANLFFIVEEVNCLQKLGSDCVACQSPMSRLVSSRDESVFSKAAAATNEQGLDPSSFANKAAETAYYLPAV